MAEIVEEGVAAETTVVETEAEAEAELVVMDIVADAVAVIMTITAAVNVVLVTMMPTLSTYQMKAHSLASEGAAHSLHTYILRLTTSFMVWRTFTGPHTDFTRKIIGILFMF